MTAGRVVAIVQARMGSTRLPGKVLRSLCGRPILWHIVERLRAVPAINEVLVATSTDPADEAILDFARQHAIPAFAGHPTDVLDRYYHAAAHAAADPIIRVTADCPFVEPPLVQRAIDTYRALAAEAQRPAYVYVNSVSAYPDGLDAEVFGFAALSQAWREAQDPFEREHATSFITRRPEQFTLVGLDSIRDVSHVRLTVDTLDDFALADAVYRRVYDPSRHFSLEDVLALLDREPALLALNGQAPMHDAYQDRRALRRRQIGEEVRQVVH